MVTLVVLYSLAVKPGTALSGRIAGQARLKSRWELGWIPVVYKPRTPIELDPEAAEALSL